MNDIELSFCFSEGFTFTKLLDYLSNNTDNGILTFTERGFRYNELISQGDGSKKTAGSLYLKNVCEFHGDKLVDYIYKFREPEYSVCFSVAVLKSILKGSLKKDQIHIYKTVADQNLYIRLLKSEDLNSVNICFLKPLKMEDQNIFRFPDPSREEETPNCIAEPNKFKKDCSRISPTNYKNVTIKCYNKRIEIAAISADEINGHIITYGSSKIVPKLEIDLSKLNININKIISEDIMVAPVDVNIIDDSNPLNINIPTRAFKNLVKISQLSSEPIKFIFKRNYIKIVTVVGTYGILRTFISNDS